MSFLDLKLMLVSHYDNYDETPACLSFYCDTESVKEQEISATEQTNSINKTYG